MNRKIEINGGWLSTLGYCIFFLLLPFKVKYNNLGLILLFLSLLPQLILSPSSIKKGLQLYWRNFYPIVFYYLYLCASFVFVYSLDPEMRHLETRTAMLALPLLLSYLQFKSRKDLVVICLSFILVISVLSVIGIIFYAKYFNQYGEVSTWILTRLILIMHRPIWGLYILGSFVLVYYMLYVLRVKGVLKTCVVVLSLVNLLFLILSQAKSSILAFVMIVIFALCYDYFIKGRLQKKSVIFLLSGIMILIILSVGLYFHNARYFFFLSESIRISLDYRFAHWSCALASIKEYFVFGTGTGMQDIVLNSCYSIMGREDLLGYNTHNQYFELLLETGLVGFGLVVFWLGRLFYKAFEVRNTPLLFWLIVIVIAMSTENVFSTQKAVLILFSILGLLVSAKQHTDKIRN